MIMYTKYIYDNSRFSYWQYYYYYFWVSYTRDVNTYVKLDSVSRQNERNERKKKKKHPDSKIQYIRNNSCSLLNTNHCNVILMHSLSRSSNCLYKYIYVIPCEHSTMEMLKNWFVQTLKICDSLKFNIYS